MLPFEGLEFVKPSSMVPHPPESFSALWFSALAFCTLCACSQALPHFLLGARWGSCQVARVTCSREHLHTIRVRKYWQRGVCRAP